MSAAISVQHLEEADRYQRDEVIIVKAIEALRALKARAPRQEEKVRIDIDPNGHLEVITGCMFSGKTSELLRRIDRLERAGYSCTLIKPDRDTRYSQDCVATHKKEYRQAVRLDGLAIPRLLDIVHQTDVVGIDEAQFFQAIELVRAVSALVRVGKQVIVAGLDMDFRGEPFDGIPTLLAQAESVTKLTAVCRNCHRDATFTGCLTPGPDIICVGADDKYVALCRHCHTKCGGNASCLPNVSPTGVNPTNSPRHTTNITPVRRRLSTTEFIPYDSEDHL